MGCNENTNMGSYIYCNLVCSKNIDMGVIKIKIYEIMKIQI